MISVQGWAITEQHAAISRSSSLSDRANSMTCQQAQMVKQ